MARIWVVLILVYLVALHAQNNTPPEVRPAAGNAATNQPPSTPDSTALEFIHVVEPAYPLDAVKRKLQGLVTLKVIVSEAGDADSETVISGDPDLAQAAVDAVKKWKFKPFIRNAKPARVSVILPFDFIFVDEAIDPHAKTGTGSSPASFPNARAMKIIWVATGAERRERVRKKVNPIYPDIAKAAHIQGEVVLIAVISKDGHIRQLNILSGHPLLTEAAVNAVKLWEYQPYVINGEPVEVQTKVTVISSLAGS